MNTLKKIGVAIGATVVTIGSTFAQSSPPLDLSSVGTTVAGYVAAAAGAGVALLGALWGVRAIIRAFKTVK